MTALVATATLLLPAAARAARNSTTPDSSCGVRALALSEALEPVIEAVTDGRPERVLPAARRAQGWWAIHRAGFPDTAAIAPYLRALAVEAGSRHAPLAARAAVRAAAAALDGCPNLSSSEAQLMRVDLAGMAAWLRAHGVDVEFPAATRASGDALVAKLRARGHGVLADRFRADVVAAMAIGVGVNGNVSAAHRLLDLVDEVEKALP